MAVNLQSPLRSRERILVMGHEGGGKSSNILYLADQCPDSNFWICDTDNSYERLFETEHADLQNLRFGGSYYADYGEFNFCPHADPYSWEGQRDMIAHVQQVMERDDWLVIDLEDKLWQYVQSFFIEQTFRQGIDDYFMAVRAQNEKMRQAGEKDKKSLGALKGWDDWPVINKVYHEKVSGPLLKSNGHLYIVTGTQKLSDDDDRGVKELYGGLGSRPTGQKGTGHLMQTVLYQSSNPRNGEHKLHTIKDRGRGIWNGEVFVDFVEDYFIGTAGWTRGFVR